VIALYHFITFITLLHLSLYRFYRIYHLITFLMKKPSLLPVIIGTGFGSGFSPFAPGTAGALLATLIWFGLSYLVSSACLLWLTVALILVFTLAGIWAANCLEASWGEDPSRVVVDEMVGVWIALLAAPAGHVWYALGALVLFRLFDIFKPLGIRRMESLPGGIGVMMDDILSGVYGFIILIVARWIIS
jgi:phosphatidylglycerophosphatase A